ncbi:MAG: sigma-70 family RNA polymerase sigma factor [Balneolaceae bacterium]
MKKAAQTYDYSLLVDPLRMGDHHKIEKSLEDLILKLKQYLEVVMGANREASEECAQQAFLNVYERIKKDKIRNKKHIYTYMIKACRHEYIRYIKKQHSFLSDDNIEQQFPEPAEQIENLADKERMEILKICLLELDEDSREFITHFMNSPETTTKEASQFFNISEANVRTKKYRITKMLHEAYQKRSTYTSESLHPDYVSKTSLELALKVS